MARSSQVPEFGKWDDGEDVPYTAYFDNATRAKSERLNPNDPLHREEISDTVKSNYERHKVREGIVVRRQTGSPLHRDALSMPGRDYDDIKSAKSRGQQASRPKHVHEYLSSEDGYTKKHLDSPLDHQTRGKVSFNSPLHPRQGNNTANNSSKRPMRNGAGSDGSIENSPLHPRQHPRIGPNGVVPSSPLRDRRGSSLPKGGSHDVIAPRTPGRCQRSVLRGNETPDRSATVPKFGDWDEGDPSSSENYSNIFTRVRDQRRTEDGSLPAGSNVSHANGRNRSGAENSKKCCCFPWGK